MNNNQFISEDLNRGGDNGTSTAQIIAFTAAAAVTAAAVGVATYIYFQRKAISTPQHILDRCRNAIDQIERSLDVSHA